MRLISVVAKQFFDDRKHARITIDILAKRNAHAHAHSNNKRLEKAKIKDAQRNYQTHDRAQDSVFAPTTPAAKHLVCLGI